MSSDDPWSASRKERGRPKTLWLKESTLEKLSAVQARAADPDKPIQHVKAAVDEAVDRMFKSMPEKNQKI